MAPETEPLERARTLVAAAERITVLTGAGISTDSGIPDYRGPNGVWTRDPKAERTSNLRAYLGDETVRRLSWQLRLRSPTWTARPNAAHHAVVSLERQGRLVALLTQNVDGLHQLAGNQPELVVELHGTMRRVRCWECGDEGPMAPVLDRVRAGDPDPRCPDCGGVLKSTTVSFGQSLDPEALHRAEVAIARCDLLLAVGTTLAVHPAAGLVPRAAAGGARVVIVNAQPTRYDSLAEAVVREPIGTALPALLGREGVRR